MQALFLIQIQNLKSDFRGFDFLHFLEIKFESNLSKTSFSRTKSQIEYHSFSLSSTGFHRIKQTSKNDNDRSDFIFIFFSMIHSWADSSELWTFDSEAKYFLISVIDLFFVSGKQKKTKMIARTLNAANTKNIEPPMISLIGG